jgi:hypothetical protein
MMTHEQEEDRLATPQEACREFAHNYGAMRPEKAWVLTDYDTWEPNPHYAGPPVPHPESYEAEHGLPLPPAPVVAPAPVEVSCQNDDVPF